MEILSDIALAIKKINENAARFRYYEKYYKGEQTLAFASDKFKTKFGIRMKKFCDNLCRTVINAPSDRLEIVNFSSVNSEIQDAAWLIWKRSQMPRHAKKIHRAAFKTKDAYVTVWANDEGQTQIYPQKSDECAVWTDGETGRVVRGAKMWRGLDNKYYLTLYYPDRIEKYITKNVLAPGALPRNENSFQKRDDAPGGFKLDNPIGRVSMFHFSLESSLLDDVIPLNDALNKTICDMLIGSEYNSLRQRWTTGIEYETDAETGKKVIPFDMNAQFFTTSKETAKFGEFADLALADFKEIINDFRVEIAAVSGIPTYYFKQDGVSVPSGEALEKLETRLTSLVSDAQLDYGEGWAAAMAFALESEGDIKPGEQIEAQWKPAAALTATGQVNLAIQKKQIGVSEERLQSEIGYTAKDIEEMKTQNSEKQASAADSFARSFNAGGAAA